MRLVAAVLIFAAAPALAADPGDAARYRACIASAGAEPGVAITEATKWLGAGGGVPARHCLGLAYLADRQFAPATATLEAAAKAADTANAALVPALWGQAGNAALAGGDAARGFADLSTALDKTADPGERIQLLTDRSRALVELKRDGEARADLATATAGGDAPADTWLLKATLARRSGDLKLAEASLLEAARRAPGDADIGLESGNLAAAQGKLDLARKAWEVVAAGAPGTPAGVAATQALAANPAR